MVIGLTSVVKPVDDSKVIGLARVIVIGLLNIGLVNVIAIGHIPIDSHRSS